MTIEILDQMTDEEFVQVFKKWAEEQGKSFTDVERNNEIDTRMLMPCFDILVHRGIESVRKLVALTGDGNPSVQRDAASFAFEAAPDICRQTLLKLATRQDPHALLAWMALARSDPSSAPSLGELYKRPQGT